MEDKDYSRLLAWAVPQARKEFVDYIRLCDPGYKLGRMHRFIANELGKVERGEVKRLMIETPPRFGKSRLVAIEWPTYMLGKNPREKFIIATHTNSLAQDHSTQARDRIWSPIYQRIFPDTAIRQDFSSVKHWKTTQGGEYHTAGVTVKLSGFPATKLILDDMYSDYAAANSETIREAVYNWYQSTAKTRLQPQGAIVIIGTRWHIADLQAKVSDALQAEKLKMLGAEEMIWRCVKLPEQAEEEDPLGREVGETLCPELWTDKEMRMIEAETEAHIWSALYKCRPTVIGGNYLKTEHFEVVSPSDVPINQRWMRYWDLAYTTKQTSDYTASLKGFMSADGTLWLADMVRNKWTFPEAKNRIKLQSDIEGITLGVESGGPQVAMSQELRNIVTNAPVIEIIPVVDKVARANRWAVLLQNKKVKLVNGPWVSEFIAECEAFPRGKHDDQVDAVSGLFELLHTGASATPIDSKPRDWAPSLSDGGGRMAF